jgi:heme-degrading monooxygenase HmoA
MYARVTQLEIDPVRIDVGSAVELYKQDVVPTLANQDGFSGVLALVTPEGKGLVVTFWDTEEQADASHETGFYADVLSRFVTLFRSPPGRERYEVVLSDLPSVATR